MVVVGNVLMVIKVEVEGSGVSGCIDSGERDGSSGSVGRGCGGNVGGGCGAGGKSVGGECGGGCGSSCGGGDGGSGGEHSVVRCN